MYRRMAESMRLWTKFGDASRSSAGRRNLIGVALLLVLLLSVVAALGRQLFLELRAFRHLRRVAEAENNTSPLAQLSGYRKDGSVSLASLSPGKSQHLLAFVAHPDRSPMEARLYLDEVDWLRNRGVLLLAVCSGTACTSQGASGVSGSGSAEVTYAGYMGMKAVADADASGMILLLRADSWAVERRLRRPASAAELEGALGEALKR
jgi:hypothetical protein